MKPLAAPNGFSRVHARDLGCAVIIALSACTSTANTDAPVATQLFASGFENPVTLSDSKFHGNADQYLRGGDVPGHSWDKSLFQSPASSTAWILSVVGESTPMPGASYGAADLQTIMGRDGRPSRALALEILAPSPATRVQQLLLHYAHMKTEAVFYQRMWIKFDAATLKRARTIGSRDFYQMFWEVKAEPDYRIRLELRLDPDDRLVWYAQADALVDDTPIWSGRLGRPVVMAGLDQAQGWHKVEIWMDRPAGRFKVGIDGQILIDRQGSMVGRSQNRINLLHLCMVYSDVAPIAQTWFDDLEIWTSPPADAWSP